MRRSEAAESENGKNESEKESPQPAADVINAPVTQTVMMMQKTVDPRAQRRSAPPPKTNHAAPPQGGSINEVGAAGGSGAVVGKGGREGGLWTLPALVVVIVMGLTVAVFLQLLPPIAPRNYIPLLL